MATASVGATRILTACGGGAQSTASPVVTTDAAAATRASPGRPFYGINAHFTDNSMPNPTWPLSTYVNTFTDLGVKMVRTNISDAIGASSLVPFFQLFAASGIAPLVVIDQGIDLTNSYAANYSASYSLGQSIARPLRAHCIYFECSNEFDFACRVDFQNRATVNPVDGKPVDGSIPTDYVPAAIEAMRGWTAGMQAGIKSAIPRARCGYASGVAFSNVVADMLFNGKDTTGAITQTPIPLDFIGVHWYSSEYDILAAGPSTHTNQPVNVLQQLNAVMSSKPIIVSEFGTWDTQANQAQYLTNQFDVWRTNRSQYNIVAALFYALFPNPVNEGETPEVNWGLIEADGTIRKEAYAAYKNYTATHPV
ncbi:hypothetical protein [Paraburkholderia bryophila]|uniref:Glycosyl hydrolase n=1 Tax=Paraburkholderia bryophila TaxID=420952 RepID=A0A7Y9W6D6_9BURK|nr:hypothetical protein [Paraburkholderia bryophila]NYH14491.1 hypothetical protein [Paraburkholderia bryophila]